MIPYWEAPLWDVGGYLIYPPIFLIGFAVLLGHFLLLRRAGRKGLSVPVAGKFSAALIVGGFFAAHAHKYFYVEGGWAAVWQHPQLLLQVWSGLASLGGILGGIAAGLAALWWQKIPRKSVVQYFDALAFVFPQAWIFGRMHCAWVHDHPGIRTSSWLGVQYPRYPRYDLGILEVLYLAVVIAWFYWLDRKPRAAGFYVVAFLVPYGCFRLWLDTLHVSVVRYAGLSVDQWSSLAAIGAGVLLARWNRRIAH